MAKRWQKTTTAVFSTGLLGAGFLGAGFLGAGLLGTGTIATAAPATLETTPCQALLSAYVDRALPKVTAYGWEGFGWRDGLYATPSPTAGGDVTSAKTPYAAKPSATGTNVQENGVDEPDLTKTNGTTVFRIKGRDLESYDVTGKQPRLLSTTKLTGVQQAELLLSGNLLIVTGTAYRDGMTAAVLRTFDVSKLAAPVLLTTTRYNDATLDAVRQHGSVVRAVVETGLPRLDFVFPNKTRTAEEALAANKATVRSTTIEDWLPYAEVRDASDIVISNSPAVTCDNMQFPPADNADLGATAIVAFDSTKASTPTTGVGIATTTDTTYSSTDRLFLAASPGWWGNPWGPVFRESAVASSKVASDWQRGITKLYSFALDGATTSFAASGEVKGTVRDRWSMDFADGALRLGVGSVNRKQNWSSVVTMKETDGELLQLGRLDRLGVNEELKSVRWFDDRAILVTFRQIDPLYVVDLANPAKPTKLSELKIPGFSSYLHPLGTNRLIGMGTNVRDNRSAGAQAALFATNDLRRTKQLSVVHYPENSYAGAGTDPRQFTWLPTARTALTVITGMPGGERISVLKVHGGRLHNTMLFSQKSGWSADTRLVPLADERVVLVNRAGVRFLNLR